MEQNQNLKPLPGITDKSLDLATTEFLFVNNVLSQGVFSLPTKASLSQYELTLNSAFSQRFILGRMNDEENSLFIGIESELANILLKMDFSIIVNDSSIALSVNAIGCTFIVKIPVVNLTCAMLKSELLGAEQISEETKESPMSFLDALEQEAEQIASIVSSTDLKINVYPYSEAFGVDFKLNMKKVKQVAVSFSELNGQVH